MWLGARIGVVIPAYRERLLIRRTLARIPPFVDGVWVVDDGSDDGTAQAASSCSDPRLRVLEHPQNRGVGAAIVTGYRAALEAGSDVLAVMAGDDQMDPSDLEKVIDPVARHAADYVKGNRFIHPEARRMPLLRRVGGEILSLASRTATGLSVSDCQCGFTALSARTAAELPLQELYPRFGYPNDLLGMLAARGFRVFEVAVRPVYADEKSGIRPWHLVSILGVVGRRWRAERRRRAGSAFYPSIARSTSRSA